MGSIIWVPFRAKALEREGISTPKPYGLADGVDSLSTVEQDSHRTKIQNPNRSIAIHQRPPGPERLATNIEVSPYFNSTVLYHHRPPSKTISSIKSLSATP